MAPYTFLVKLYPITYKEVILMTPVPTNPAENPAIKFCQLIMDWLNRDPTDKGRMSLDDLAEKLQIIFDGSGTTGPSRIGAELRQHNWIPEGSRLTYTLTSIGPELNADCIKNILRNLQKRYKADQKGTKQPNKAHMEEKPCVEA